ncbi:Lsr2 protein [Geodermatophilus africanus]|uniref:Lsr2 protein n=1 Tax=Geodermatophilus africanus TaxID=1137993 RepID=A0A1H3NE41_9ACTN|nr:histone-like nucleoid-structuring protein Lsr2 [Geodermatophilus africanus]SDY87034.1 Lsr2 protein [Geodermatophilus africanus]
MRLRHGPGAEDGGGAVACAGDDHQQGQPHPLTGGGRRSAPAAKPTYAGYDPAAVRAWAAGQGIEVNARGRIKAEVVEKFRAAGN